MVNQQIKVPNKFCLLAWMIMVSLIFISCSPKKENADSTAFEEKPVMPVERQPSPRDTQTAIAPKNESPAQEQTPTYPKPTPKTCEPNFTLIGKKKNNHYFYYVTGFNAGEFACWEVIEKHGQELANEQPCTIYYLDSPKASLTSNPPHYLDASVLKEHGIGSFIRDEHYWVVRGAKTWGRQENKYGYFNTNDKSGG